jgi:hypothetical protein
MTIFPGYDKSVRGYMARKAKEKEDFPYRGPMFSKVVSAIAESERVKVQSVANDTVITFPYPFASTNAWIRGQPEAATTILSVIGADSNDLQPIGYVDTTKAAVAKTYSDVATNLRGNPTGVVPKTQPYRVLAPGDIDLGSNFAQTFMGLKDVYQARGGLSHLVMTSKATTVEAPIFEVHGPAHQTLVGSSDGVNDEIRYGAVRRPTLNATRTSQALVRSPYLSILPSSLGAPAFAKEWTVVLHQHGLPRKLLDHRQGVVVEDDGTIGKALRTGKNLRARMQWMTLADKTAAEIDDEGNWSFTTAVSGTEGGIVDVPTGHMNVSVGQTFTLRSIREMEIASSLASLNVSAATGFRMSTPARGEVEGTFALALKSLGTIQIDTPMVLGVSIGSELGIKYPVLVGHPAYLTTQEVWHSSETALDNLIATYGQAAAQAWAAIGPLTALLDPTMTVPALCLTAGAAAAAMAAGATAANTALGAHMPTLVSMPAGYISNKTVSE